MTTEKNHIIDALTSSLTLDEHQRVISTVVSLEKTLQGIINSKELRDDVRQHHVYVGIPYMNFQLVLMLETEEHKAYTMDYTAKHSEFAIRKDKQKQMEKKIEEIKEIIIDSKSSGPRWVLWDLLNELENCLEDCYK